MLYTESMNGYEQFLVILLSTFLAIFLILGIALFAYLIKIARSVARITEKAEHIAEKAEAVGEFFEKAAGPLAVGRIFAAVAEKFFSKQSGNEKSKRKDS